jgi:hypothetical protein
MNGGINGYVVQGQYYKLLETQNPWGKIETQSGLQGWIYLPNYTILSVIKNNPTGKIQKELSMVAFFDKSFKKCNGLDCLQHRFKLKLPLFLKEKDYEIYYNDELIPNDENHISHSIIHGTTDTDFFLCIDTSFIVFSEKISSIVFPNWKIRYEE